MLRAIRQKLRRIRYYSARREPSVWSDATDLALVLALVLAPPANWAASHLFIHRAVIVTHGGPLLRHTSSGDIVAAVNDEEKPVAHAGAPGDVNLAPHGNWAMQIIEHRHGWPVVTTRRTPPPNVTIDLFSRTAAQEDVTYREGALEHEAIAAALRADGRQDAAARWRTGATATRHYLRGWTFGSLVWWPILFLAAVIGITCARGAVHLGRRRQHVKRLHRETQGKCAHCGYDLRGNEFAERCPECGRLVW